MLRRRLQRLRQPKYLIGFFVGLLYFYWLILRPAGSPRAPRPFAGETAPLGQVMAVGGLAALVLFTWIFGTALYLLKDRQKRNKCFGRYLDHEAACGEREAFNCAEYLCEKEYILYEARRCLSVPYFSGVEAFQATVHMPLVARPSCSAIRICCSGV